VTWDDISYEPPIACIALAGDDSGIADAVALQQCSLDLAKLDPVAPDLYLVIQTTEELDIPAGKLPAHVTAAVHPASGLAEWIWHETFGCQSRTIKVPPRETCSGNVDFTYGPCGDRFKILVKDVDARVRNRLANGEAATVEVLGNVVAGGERGSLCRTVTAELVRGATLSSLYQPSHHVGEMLCRYLAGGHRGNIRPCVLNM
jgi:hypothetical protein